MLKMFGNETTHQGIILRTSKLDTTKFREVY